jgi:hypothetical protein
VEKVFTGVNGKAGMAENNQIPQSKQMLCGIRGFKHLEQHIDRAHLKSDT